MVEDDSDSDDAIIDEFLPSLNRTKVVTELTSAPSDDDFEPSYPSLGQLASALSKSRNHNDDGTVYLAACSDVVLCISGAFLACWPLQ